jgi:hypothetical protein
MKAFLIFMFLINISFDSYSQLDSITQIHGLGCGGGGVGQSIPIWVDTVPGATQYCFSNGDTTISTLLFDGQIGPYCSSSNQIMITFSLAQPFYIICVTAYSATDSSNTFCDTIYALVAPLFFSPGNDSLVSPNSSGLYSLLPFAGGGCEPVSFFWWITGDANINGIDDSLQTVSDSITINFGPGFISGQLCVYGTTSFNLAGPHICMTINAPVGISVPDDNTFQVYYDHENELVHISFDSKKIDELVEIIDLQGKVVYRLPFISNISGNKLSIKTNEFPKGIYIVRLKGTDVPVSGKFIKH